VVIGAKALRDQVSRPAILLPPVKRWIINPFFALPSMP
jgi:hypothetical protein